MFTQLILLYLCLALELKNKMMGSGKIVVFLTIVIATLVACSTQEDEFEDSDIIKIELGTVCGWCGGEEKIVVTSIREKYYRNIPCGKNEGITSKSVVHRNKSDWDELVLSFDLEYFKTLDYSECNICLDGCDEFIIVTTGNSTYKITYTPELNIEGLENLRLLLNSRFEEFRK